MGLANLLFEYDLLGVYQNPEIRSDDDEEYDDLVSTLREGLELGQSPRVLSEMFADVLRASYGLDGVSANDELPFMEKVHDWWHSNFSGP